MFLDDLLKACVVQLGELGQVMHIGNDVANIFLEQLKIFLELIAVLIGSLLQFGNGIVDLAL